MSTIRTIDFKATALNETRQLSVVLGIAFCVCVLSYMFFRGFEQATENAFGLLQGALYFPILAHVSTELPLLCAFWSIYFAVTCVAALRLPKEFVDGKILSNLFGCYVLAFCPLLLVIFMLMPDTLYKVTRFFQLLVPLFVNPASMLAFMLAPLPVTFYIYRKRKLKLITVADMVRVTVFVALWLGAMFSFIRIH